MVDLLTGYCNLNRHLCTTGLAEEALGRFCKEKEEIAEHILYDCEGLTKV